MRIALTMRVVENDSYKETRDSISHDWIEWCENHGMFSVLLPNNLKDVNHYLSQLSFDVIVLTGGNDIIPSGKSGSTFSLQRNLFEKCVIDFAIYNNVPIFAVCRGFQFVNKYFGGGLNMDISSSMGDQESHVAVEHTVTLNDTFKNMFKMSKLVTNSYHDHGVFESDLAEPLVSFANSNPSGLVEAYHHKDLPIIGLQWHPERETKSKAFDIKVLTKLVHKKIFWKS